MRNAWSVAWVACFIGAGQLGLALAPSLGQRLPALLLVLRPQADLMLLLGPQLPAAVVVLLVVPFRLLFHIAYYEFGRWGGDRLVRRSRAGRWVLALLARRGVVLPLLALCVLHPSTPVDLALGARAVSRPKAIGALATGVIVSTALLALLGAALAPLSLHVLAKVTEHRGVLTAVLAAFALVTSAVVAWRLRQTARSVAEDHGTGAAPDPRAPNAVADTARED